jgi:hypothetical protein
MLCLGPALLADLPAQASPYASALVSTSTTTVGPGRATVVRVVQQAGPFGHLYLQAIISCAIFFILSFCARAAAYHSFGVI